MFGVAAVQHPLEGVVLFCIAFRKRQHDADRVPWPTALSISNLLPDCLAQSRTMLRPNPLPIPGCIEARSGTLKTTPKQVVERENLCSMFIWL